jgi:hypothetical protein
MADALAVDIKASLHWLFQESLDLATVTDTARLEYARSLADGVSLDQADKLWHDQRTLAAGASENLDLTALTNSVFGSTVTISFLRVKALMIVNLATTANEDLAVGGAGAGANGWHAPFKGNADAKVVVAADSTLLWINKKHGWTVLNNSSDILKIANDGLASETYRIAVVGASS